MASLSVTLRRRGSVAAVVCGLVLKRPVRVCTGTPTVLTYMSHGFSHILQKLPVKFLYFPTTASFQTLSNSQFTSHSYH
jgi:hypothetical protein